MIKRFIGLSLLLISLAVLISCGKSSGNKGIDLNLTMRPDTITDSLYVKMTYDLNITDKYDGSLTDDYKLFVHFWRAKNKEMLLVDDHSPETKFSQWKKGDKIAYSRIVYIPRFLDEFDIDFEGSEQVRVTVGLYNPASPDESFILHQKNIPVFTASQTAPEIVFDEGWHQQETDLKIQNPDERSWRWTSRKAVCIIENPKKDCLLIIRGGADKTKFQDQKITLKINDAVLEEFIPETAKFAKEYVITHQMMGTSEEFKLIMETDKTFVPTVLNPEVKDDRELGFQIYFLYFRENVK